MFICISVCESNRIFLPIFCVLGVTNIGIVDVCTVVQLVSSKVNSVGSGWKKTVELVASEL